MDEKSKVYILVDPDGRILACDGGYTISNIEDISAWILIDEGDGDRYNLCQSHYFDALRTDDGICRYRYDGEIILRSAAEIEADREEMHEERRDFAPSIEERVNDLEIAVCEIMDAL